MWLVYENNDDDGMSFVNAFSSKEKAIAYRDKVCEYANIREAQINPEPPIDMQLVTLSWRPGQEIFEGIIFARIGHGFQDESEIEETKSWGQSFYARAATKERAKELLAKIIPKELQEKYSPTI